MAKMTRQAYAEMYGPTVGDRVRLGDTELIIEVEEDRTCYGDEVKFGGGKVIREIIDKTGVSIDINDDGLVSIASADAEAAAKAVEFVENLTQEVEVGKIYLGKVKKIVDFGAFVEIFPGTDGLVHISQICDRRIKSVSDEIQEGDEIKVKVIDVDQQGKVKLSRKEALKDAVEAAAPTAT